MIDDIPKSWQKVLDVEFQKTYFEALKNFVDREYEFEICFPTKENIFSALEKCAFENTKVIIIGQDPYHRQGQANGLSFSVKSGVKNPPSLVNIFKELQSDLSIPCPVSGDLTEWANQGVLMLNTILTVRKSAPGSHKNVGWEQFTDAIIENLSDKKQNLVFMLWGGFAQKKGAKIDREKHCILESGHPSPMSANRGYWFGNNNFSQCNSYLKKYGLKPIDWSLEQPQGLLFT